MKQIPVTHTEWNVEPLGAESSFLEKRKKWEEATNKFIEKWKGKENYTKSPAVLKEALDDYEEWNKQYGSTNDEVYYYWLKGEQNQNDDKVKAKFNKVEAFSKKIENSMHFFILTIAKIPEEERKTFLEHDLLSEYRHFLERVFQNEEHMLSEREEKIMNMKSTSSYSLWTKLTSDFLVAEEKEVLDEEKKKVTKTFSDLFPLMQSKKKEVRDSAGNALNEILEKYADVATAEINALLQDKMVNDELRGYKRPDAARHKNDDVESEVIDALVSAVEKKYNVAHKFYELKAKLLGQEKLAYHERNVEYGNTNKTYSYEDSIQLIYKVFDNLDPKFSALLEEFVVEGKIDVYPRKGKSQGAFCVHFLKSQPTYVLLNHTDKLNDVRTFAHEMGHAINNELMKEKQNALNFSTTLATAEVASTFMEDFVLEELMNEADDELKLALYVQKLDADISSIIRQIACYKFEQELHKSFREKGHLSKEDIGNIFKENMENYMGSYVEQSNGSENWWVYWSHIRRYFYVYSYASGLLISKAMQRKVRENKKFIEQVKDFLSSGTSSAPSELFKEMGINIKDSAFWETGLFEIEELLEKTKTLAQKLGKINHS